MVQEDGALEGVELRGVGRNLGEEGIGHENSRLVAMAGGGVTQQGGDVDLKGSGETIERGESGHRLPVLDLGNIGTRDIHAGGELTLREVAHVAQVANGSGHLNAIVGGRWLGNECDGGGSRLRLLDLEAFVAAAAQGVCRAELYQAAVVTA